MSVGAPLGVDAVAVLARVRCWRLGWALAAVLVLALACVLAGAAVALWQVLGLLRELAAVAVAVVAVLAAVAVDGLDAAQARPAGAAAGDVPAAEWPVAA